MGTEVQRNPETRKEIEETMKLLDNCNTKMKLATVNPFNSNDFLDPDNSDTENNIHTIEEALRVTKQKGSPGIDKIKALHLSAAELSPIIVIMLSTWCETELTSDSLKTVIISLPGADFRITLSGNH